MNRIAFGLAALTIILAAQEIPSPAARDLSLDRRAKPSELKVEPQVRRGYAVVIGISNYKNAPEAALRYPEKDAENLYAALISKQGGNMEYENVLKLIGPRATLENIRDALEKWLPSKAQEGDRVVVYYAGHGYVDETGRGYLVPYDVELDRVAQTGYPMDRLGDVISKQVKSLWKVLLVDACHSGMITTSNTFARIDEGLRALPQGFLTLRSSRASESSYEDPELAGGNGVFTYFLVKGWLGDADSDPRDGVVTADELLAYVEREVRVYAKAHQRQQNPGDSGAFPDDLILGYSPSRRQQLVASFPELADGSIVVMVNLDNVEIYIDDQRYGVASPNANLAIPGLSSGIHKVKGVRMGYEPVVEEINVVPGSSRTVSLRLLRQRVVKPAAKALYDEGEVIWRRSNSSASDLTQAADLYSKALKADSSYSIAALGLCRVQKAQGKLDDALKSCSKATQIDKDYVAARQEYGTVLMETGDYPEAVRQFQTVVQADPKSAFVHSLLAEAYFLADRPKEAEVEAQLAIDIDALSGQGYLMRAEARRVQKRFDEAAVDYHRALDLEEFKSGGLKRIAFYAIGTGIKKNRSGRRTLYRAHAAQAYYGLCACELQLERYQLAVKFCNQSLGIERDDPDTHLLLYNVYATLFNQNNSDRDYLVKSKENLAATLRINPDQEDVAQLRNRAKEIDDLLTKVR